MKPKKYRVVEVIRGSDKPIFRIEYQEKDSLSPTYWFTSVYRDTLEDAVSAIGFIRERETVREEVVWSD